MRSKLIGTFFGVMFLASFSVCQASAAEFSVTVKNLTNATWFTPLLITAHSRNTDLFETGESATEALRAMAEGGDISGLLAYVNGRGADSVANPAGGLLAPGAAGVRRRPATVGTRNLAMESPCRSGTLPVDYPFD